MNCLASILALSVSMLAAFSPGAEASAHSEERRLIEEKETAWREQGEQRREGARREREKVEAYLALHPSDVDMLIYYGICLDREGRYREAALQFALAMDASRKFEMAESWRNTGQERGALARWIREAEDELRYRSGQGERVGIAEAHYELGMLLTEAGDFERAFIEFSHAYELNKSSHACKRMVAESLEKRNLREAYIRPFLQKAFAKLPERGSEHVIKGEEKASREAEATSSAKKSEGEWRRGEERRMAELMSEKKRIEEQLVDTPLDSYLLLSYGICLEKAGRYEEASAQFEKALGLNPDFELGRIMQGVAKRKVAASKLIRNAEKAIRDYAGNYDSGDLADLHRRLGETLLSAGDYSRSFDEFRHACELDSESVVLKKRMSEAYQKKMVWERYVRKKKEEDSVLMKVASIPRLGEQLFRLHGDKHIIYGLKPNVDITISHSLGNQINYKTNSLGLRNEEIELPKKSGIYRILVLGDSIAFGYHVPFEKTYPQVLEKLLNQNRSRSGIEGYEVINAGVQGYSTYNEVGYFEKKGIMLDPDMVIIDFCFNDVENPAFIFDNRTLKALGNVPKEAIPNLENVTMWDEYFLTKRLVERRKIRRRLREREFEGCVRALSDYSSPEWVWLKRMLDRMVKMASSRGIKVVLVMFPLKWQLEGEEESQMPRALMEKYCDSRAITMVDLFPYFKAEGMHSIIEDEIHPSEIGYIIAARAIAEAIGSPCLPSDQGKSDEERLVRDAAEQKTKKQINDDSPRNEKRDKRG